MKQCIGSGRGVVECVRGRMTIQSILAALGDIAGTLFGELDVPVRMQLLGILPTSVQVSGLVLVIRHEVELMQRDEGNPCPQQYEQGGKHT
jgi:hypothetical protein